MNLSDVIIPNTVVAGSQSQETAVGGWEGDGKDDDPFWS
jgi:hypothetical protein